MISPDTISRVREQTDIVKLIGENVRLQKRGRSWVGLCPFHKEKTPSFHVNQERGRFHCFGCQESGSAIDYVMKLEGLEFPDAVRRLADRVGIVVEETGSKEEQQGAARRRAEQESLYALNQLVATFFEQQLGASFGHPLAHYAHAELAKRDLSPRTDEPRIAETLQAFRIGYAPYGWDGLTSFLRQQEVSQKAAAQLGVIAPRARSTGYYDRFRHRLMFAVIDVLGRVVGFSGRALPEPAADELAAFGLPPPRQDGEQREPAKYINSPESVIYSKSATVFGLKQARQAIRQRQQAVLVEGNFDVVSLHARGIDHVVAPLGTAFTLEQAKLIRRYAPTVVVLFDGDAAGRKATRAVREPCAEAELSVRVALLPTGVDPDDYVRQHGADKIASILSRARGLLDHLIDETLGGEGFVGGSLREKQQRIQQVVQLISSENDPTLRALAKSYADKLSAQLVVEGRAPTDLRELERLLERSLGGHGPQPSRSQGPAARSPPRAKHIPLAVLGAIMDYPELLDDPEVEQELPLLDGDVALAAAALRDAWEAKKAGHALELLDLLPASIHAFAVARLASPRFESAVEAKVALLKNARKIQNLTRLQEKAHIDEELSRVGSLGDTAAEDELLREAERGAKEKLGLS